MEEKELLNNVFFVHKKVFLYLHNITFEPLMSNGLYECGSSLAVYAGSEISRISSKIS